MTPERWSEVKAVLSDVLDAPPTERPAILQQRCGPDADLRTTVESLLAMEEKAEQFDTAAMPGSRLRGADVPSKPPSHIGNYTILHEIGRGGMGVVYAADRDDGAYRKRVAIKLITTSMLMSARPELGLEARFRRERDILAQLEHPGIARLLDGGATKSGQPYFVMEYVEGPPLLTWCSQQSLDVTARISLFLSICDAVAYAHRKLIVHRDLKPGNILVTAAGEPKLLDFGLARVLAADEDPEITQAGPALMTVAYASPEQIRGERQTVASDVYSLGVILYELLTSHRPYKPANTSFAEMVRVTCEQLPVPASEWSNELRGDLEVILNKALEKDARLRYPTVDEFAADLRRHLEGKPIQARPATFFYRAGKFFRRHRIAVPAAALAALLILSFGVLSWWEALRAQRRFNDVQNLAHSVLFEFHDAIEKLPGSTAARELLVRRALEYLESLSREAGGDPRLAREIALGYSRIGDVQGQLGNSNLGKVSAGLESYRKAEEILARLVKRSPADISLRRDYLRISDGLARMYGASGDLAHAHAFADKNLALISAAARERPSDPEVLRSLVRAQGTAADLLVDDTKYAEAIPIRQSLLATEQHLSDLNPGDSNVKSNLALAHKRLGAIYGVLKRFEEARREYEEARVIDEQYASLGPREQLDLSYDYSDLGWVTIRLGDLPQALELYRKGLELRKSAAAADPNNYRAALSVAASTERIGGVLRLMGDYPGALKQTQQAVALWKELAERPGSPWSTSREFADTHAELGEVYIEMKNFQRAAAEYDQAAAIFRQLRQRGVLPKSLEPQADKLKAQADKCRLSACTMLP
jgi:tetratricopeptide (TPR) repeat protein